MDRNIPSLPIGRVNLMLHLTKYIDTIFCIVTFNVGHKFCNQYLMHLALIEKELVFNLFLQADFKLNKTKYFVLRQYD